ncbi:hypothetical protein NP493_193g01028 [Ridgeia piscesae]|uniref:Uncharacterized protein n=1 Tax=Ridgeia piscesae TaxID=27915 RepID=A0AAD9P216_RIDPI|nr:hypothetical protein NP493_193g01028 [Ridgeia piscesae]
MVPCFFVHCCFDGTCKIQQRSFSRMFFSDTPTESTQPFADQRHVSVS